ncbi:MAG: putative polymerase sigma-H factor (Sigma-30) [candidate division NC10 bacterium]|nr:putative polymerase sigma-H factor (Sigma-30) [candidate division NC10 bacterium]
MDTPSAGLANANASQDWDLVQRCLQGDSMAFADLVRRYERLVFRIAGGFLRDRGEVEDVAQEAFLKAYEALSGFRAGAPFGPWIAQIATRTCYDRLRARQRRGEVAWDDLSLSEQSEARSFAAGRPADDTTAARDLAERALATLPPKDRQALMLADAMGHTAAEVGQMMGCTALAVRLRLHRARRAMRKAAERLLDGMGKTE